MHGSHGDSPLQAARFPQTLSYIAIKFVITVAPVTDDTPLILSIFVFLT